MGYGTPLVLLHGNGEDSGCFVNQIDKFSEFRRVIAVDTRGHGASPRGSRPFTLDTFANDLNELFDKLGIDSADILGFSDGGNIALIFALKYPERVKRMVLCGANLFPTGLKGSFLIPVRTYLCCSGACSPPRPQCAPPQGAALFNGKAAEHTPASARKH